jgi:transmembrane sensor
VRNIWRVNKGLAVNRQNVGHRERMLSSSARKDAAAWVARLHSPQRSARLERAFGEWLNESPEHVSAFEEATKVWEEISGAGAQLRPAPRRLRAQAMVAACVLVAIAIVATLPGFLRGDAYQTSIGEQRVVTLSDGSRIELNTNSRVTVRYDWLGRDVKLVRGEAMFHVAKDVSRPFRVRAADRTVTALGTSFAVRTEPGDLIVTLFEGRVQVAPLKGRASRVTLAPGQRWTSRRPVATSLDQMELVSALSWVQKKAVFDDVPLSAAVAEMNRYRPDPLVIVSPELGSLPVSGIFDVDDAESFIRSVERVHGVVILTTG